MVVGIAVAVELVVSSGSGHSSSSNVVVGPSVNSVGDATRLYPPTFAPQDLLVNRGDCLGSRLSITDRADFGSLQKEPAWG